MTKSIFFLFTISLMSLTAEGSSRFCVGNFSKASLAWTIADDQGAIVDSFTAQKPEGSGYRCASDLDPQKYYSVFVDGTNGERCEFKKVRADDWLSISSKGKGIACTYQSDRNFTAEEVTPQPNWENCTTSMFGSNSKETVQLRPVSASYVRMSAGDVPVYNAGTISLNPCITTSAPMRLFATPWINIEVRVKDKKRGILTYEYGGDDGVSCRYQDLDNLPIKLMCKVTGTEYGKTRNVTTATFGGLPPYANDEEPPKSP